MLHRGRTLCALGGLLTDMGNATDGIGYLEEVTTLPSSYEKPGRGTCLVLRVAMLLTGGGTLEGGGWEGWRTHVSSSRTLEHR